MRDIRLPQLQLHTRNDIIGWIRDKMPPWVEGAVLGMSGGIDSSVVAALTAKTFKGTDWKLRAYSLPSQINPEADKTDAQIVADMFHIPLETISVTSLAQAAVQLPVLDDALLDKRVMGNLLSRLRAVVLWTLAEKHKCIVMGTGNKDEDYGVGYYTLTGDGLVRLNPIGCLSKRLVRKLGAELGLPERLVNREPTAGLELDQTDFKDLGYTYEFVELVIEARDQGFALEDAINHPQVKAEWIRMRRPAPHTPWAFGSIDAAVIDVLHRHDIALAKAKLVRPEVPSIYLGI